VIGTWAFGKMQAHVWNEVHIEGMGWLLVDTSGDQMRINMPLPGFVKRALIGRMAARIGRHNGSRFAFSIDPDVALIPPYAAPTSVPEDVERFGIAGINLAWGYELLADRAPYLQPVYVRFDSRQTLNKAQEPLGVWEVEIAGEGRFAGVARLAGIAVGAICGAGLIVVGAPLWIRLVAVFAILAATQFKPLWLRTAARPSLVTFVLAQFAARLFMP
jgi:hypothetical protein